jgi:flagellar protein FliS
MQTNGYQNYFETEVLTADPLHLVRLLYRGAVDSIGDARRYMRTGDVLARSRAITKALLILDELSCSLDHAKGGEFSARLAALYEYIGGLLVAANVNQSSQPLEEAEGLLRPLLEAWQSAEIASEPEPAYAALSCAY